jgi:hypothetical protein
MWRGTVEYKKDHVGLELSRFEVSVLSPPVTKVSVESKEVPGLTMVASIDGAPSIEAALDGAKRTIDSLSLKLAFTLGLYLGDLRLHNHALQSDDVHAVGDGMPMFCQATVVKRLNDHETAAVAQSLCRPIAPSQHPFYELFHSALAMHDPVANFMCLYLIILNICSDSQEEVDRRVLAHDSSTPTNPPHRPRRQRRGQPARPPETVYTKLRNEIGHVRAGTILDDTRADMARHLEGLKRIVKMEISALP